MKPNIRDTTDPLDTSLLPPAKGMSLDYRTQPQGDAGDRSRTVYRLIAISLLSVGAVALCRIIASALNASEATLFRVALLFWCLAYPCLAAVALVQYLRKRSLQQVIAWLAIPPATWGVLHLATASYGPLATYAIIFLPAVVFSIVLADRIAVHHAAWMMANPVLTPSTRLKWKETFRSRLPGSFADWRGRVRNARLLTTGSLPPGEAEALVYPLAAVIGLAAPVVGLLVFLVCYALPATQFFAGMLATVAIVTLFSAVWLFWNYGFQPHRLRLRLVFWVTWRAIVSWFTYNAQQTPAAGVFQSPAGPQPRRQALFAIAVFFLTLSILPLAAYFPLVLFLSGPEPWLEQIRPPEEALPVPPVPGLAEVERTLDQTERLYYESRATPEERTAYLRQVADRRTELLRAAYDLGIQQFMLGALNETPERWLVVAFRRTFRLDTFFSFAFFLSVGLSLIAGPAFFFLLVAFLAGRLLTVYYLALEDAQATQHPPGVSVWDGRVRRLRASSFSVQVADYSVREADHLWLGTSTVNDYPILLDRRLLCDHAHILGSTGSGKTALGLAPLVTQLIRIADSSVVIIDLKGDPALFHGTKLEADSAHLPFKWFTNELGNATYVFNPLIQAYRRRLTIYQRTDLLMGAFGLIYGRGYGRDYYSDIQNHLLFRALRHDPDCPSFVRLYDLLRKPELYHDMGKRELQEASHIWKIVERLASFEALNANSADGTPQAVLDNAIDMGRCFESPQVLYFYLPAALESVSVAEIARLALYSLLTAAASARERRPQVYLFIDEFQQVASSNLQIILRHARSMNIGVILANQTMADLRTPDADLTPIVSANTHFKQIFSVNDVFQQELMSRASGETIYELVSRAESKSWQPWGPWPTTRTVTCDTHEHIGPRHRVNDIIEFSNHPQRCLVQTSRGSGFTQFGGLSFIMATQFHITRDEYRRRSEAPWPLPNQGTISPEVETPAPREETPEQDDRRAAAEATYEQMNPEDLERLLQQAKDMEGPPATPPPKGPDRRPRRQAKNRDKSGDEPDESTEPD